jgi:polyisoprenoid-binding protein YceI
MKSSWLIRRLANLLFLTILVSNVSAITGIERSSPVTPGGNSQSAPPNLSIAAHMPPIVTYRINPGQSRFMANVGSGGLLWFMGHTHHFAVRDFSGEATLTPDSLAPASLQMTIKAASLEETGKNFTDQQKQIINKEARNEVLEADKYPEIVFKSTNVKGKMTSAGHYQVKIAGDLTLHGVTRQIEIPAQVTVNGNNFEAAGEFSVNRSDFKVKAKSIKAGMIRVRNKITFEFDIKASAASI